MKKMFDTLVLFVGVVVVAGVAGMAISAIVSWAAQLSIVQLLVVWTGAGAAMLLLLTMAIEFGRHR